MTTRRASKPKPPESVSQYHPLKLWCDECGAGPYLLCVECGAEWSDSFKKIHIARIEACKMQMVFE